MLLMYPSTLLRTYNNVVIDIEVLFLYSSVRSGELLSQPRPEGLTEIICPQGGTERVDVALVYPPTPTAVSPCCK